MKYAIMFADVVGSTRLYEELGDHAALDCINQSISRMAEITIGFNGMVINTLGDEIMCRFDTADAAVQAACRIHEVFNIEPIENHNVILSLRIGMHFGEIVHQEDDVFGDVVNVASRVANIATAKQIITTQALIDELSDGLMSKTREFDHIEVRGKLEPLKLFEVLWGNRDITMMRSAVSSLHSDQNLHLTYNDQKKILHHRSSAFNIGRNPDNDLIVEAELVSRLHAYCVYRRGKFILVDQSTNGTFVQTSDAQEIYIRREELPLIGSGTIGLGESTSVNNGQLIQFICV